MEAMGGGDDPYGVARGATGWDDTHGAMGGNAHEFGVEENLRKTIKQPGAGWTWYTCMEAMGGDAHEFGVEENLRKTIKQPGTGWARYTCMGRWAGESSRKPRRPRPYSQAFAGKTLRGMALPDIYAHAGINGKRREGGNRRGAPRRYVLRGTGE